MCQDTGIVIITLAFPSSLNHVLVVAPVVGLRHASLNIFIFELQSVASWHVLFCTSMVTMSQSFRASGTMISAMLQAHVCERDSSYSYGSIVHTNCSRGPLSQSSRNGWPCSCLERPPLPKRCPRHNCRNLPLQTAPAIDNQSLNILSIAWRRQQQSFRTRHCDFTEC
jgi:hypothetical protein